MFKEKIKKEFREFLNESKVTVFYGSVNNIDTLKQPILFNQMRNKKFDEQKGVGLFFSTNIDEAKRMGPHINEYIINTNNYINAGLKISELGEVKVVNLLKHLHNIDKEHLYYLIIDYGYEISDPEDMTDIDISNLYKLIKDDEIAGFQVSMVNMFGIEIFVDAWLKHIKLNGVYNEMVDGHKWYAIMQL